MNGTVTCLYQKINNARFLDIPQTYELERFCHDVTILLSSIEIILRHLMVLPILLLMVVCVFGHIREMYNWVIFHFG